MPVERYVPQPQPQEPSFYSPYQNTYERYSKNFINNDPYMRRDLIYHYRLPMQFPQNQYQKIRYNHLGTPSRGSKCCQFDGPRSSTGSSSSTSSITSTGHSSSIQDVQCQNINYQEKGTQCPRSSNNTNNLLIQSCRHHGNNNCDNSIEYVGASGGRRICATPPPRPSERCEGCIIAAASASAKSQKTLQNWRSTSTNPLQNIAASTSATDHHQPSTSSNVQITPRHIQHHHLHHQHHSLTPTTIISISSNTDQSIISSTTTSTNNNNNINNNEDTTPSRIMRQTPVNNLQQTPSINYGSPLLNANLPSINPAIIQQSSSNRNMVSAPQRAILHPAANHQIQAPTENAAEVSNNRSTQENRSIISRTELVRNYIKTKAANFFYVNDEFEEEEQKRWFDRRLDMATRHGMAYKNQYYTSPHYQTPTPPVERRIIHQRANNCEITGPRQLMERPDVLPEHSDSQKLHENLNFRKRKSVAEMAWEGLGYLITSLSGHPPRPRSQQTFWSRSFLPEVVQVSAAAAAAPTSSAHLQGVEEEEAEAETFFQRTTASSHEAARIIEPPTYVRDCSNWRTEENNAQLRQTLERHRSNTVGLSRIRPQTLENICDNSDRKVYGVGWLGRVFGHHQDRDESSAADAQIIQSPLEEMEDHRPYFCCWISTVQVIILIIALICYGLAPFSLGRQAISGHVLDTNMNVEQVDYRIPSNIWIGPRAADLIHLGAKFPPCMRLDEKIIQEKERLRKKEKETACCIRNDDSGCVQTSKADCSHAPHGMQSTKTISTWKKWTNGEAGPGGRISGSVCGLDPKYCTAPPSVYPHVWPDDITRWPICRRVNAEIGNAVANRKEGGMEKIQDKTTEHMLCEIIGHPCCVGIHGACKIATREYCDFVRGTFHEEASLCSQVSCLNDICGMIPFRTPDSPNQFYRLWTSLFIHAGILQLLLTLSIQFYYLVFLEKLIGSSRIAIIYIGSGVAGNLASAIFVPYQADVGPAGSLYGIIACTMVELLHAYHMLKHPGKTVCLILPLAALLFILGFFPWVDNYAHLFGFLFGLLLSYALLPYVTFGTYDRHKKVFLIWVCLLTAVILFIILVLLFYIIPAYDCKVCSYFDCIPFSSELCASQNINFKNNKKNDHYSV